MAKEDFAKRRSGRALSFISITAVFLAAWATVPLHSPASDGTRVDGFTVDSFGDEADAAPGDGVCASASGGCTLRAAIQEANATAGPDAIKLPAGRYLLTIAGTGDNTAATGDLDITDNLVIQGAGAEVTFVDAGRIDRVFHVLDPLALGVSVEIRDVTIANGYALNENGGGILLSGSEGESGGSPGGAGGCGGGGGKGGCGGGGDSGSGAMGGSTTPSAAPCALQAPARSPCVASSGPSTLAPSGASPESCCNTSLAPVGTVGTRAPAPCAAIASSEGGCGEETGGESAGPTLKLSNSVVTENMADSNQATPRIDNATGTVKMVPVGGTGGGIASEGGLVIDNSVVSSNVAAANGGGIYSAAALQITHSTVIGNRAEGGGGLFDTGSHTTTIKGSTFSGNHATGGGALTSRPRVNVFLSNTTISGNTAKDVGAGVHSNGPVDLTNCTVAFNSLPPREEGEQAVAPLAGCAGETGTEGDTGHGSSGGAGLNVFAKGRFTMRNSILVENTAGGRPANCGKTGGGSQPFIIYISRGFNLEDADTCGLDQPGDMKNVDVPVIDNQLMANGAATGPLTHALLPGSPAINKIPPDLCTVSKDQRGRPRPSGAAASASYADIGAFEVSPGDAAYVEAANSSSGWGCTATGTGGWGSARPWDGAAMLLPAVWLAGRRVYLAISRTFVRR